MASLDYRAFVTEDIFLSSVQKQGSFEVFLLYLTS